MPMILMLNGAFGAGKTTLANALLARRPDWMLFDPEEVGFLLWKLCPEPKGDFQDLKPWATLVVETARALVDTYGRTLVVPMTLVRMDNYATIRRGFEGIAPTRHFALVASPETLARRLSFREGANDTWAHAQIARCVEALRRPEFGTHLDAEGSTEALADETLASLRRMDDVRQDAKENSD